MNSDAVHTSPWKTSDALYGGALLAGLALEYVFPLTIGKIMATHIRIMLGGIILSIGILTAVLAKIQFLNAAQPSAPGKPTTRLVQDGIFSYTRNPLYLGLVIILVGLSLTFDMPWWIILAAPIIGLTQWLLIIPEEKYLMQKFEGQYFLYTARVRRWI